MSENPNDETSCNGTSDSRLMFLCLLWVLVALTGSKYKLYEAKQLVSLLFLIGKANAAAQPAPEALALTLIEEFPRGPWSSNGQHLEVEE